MQGDHPSAPGHYPDPHDRRTSRRTLQRGRKTLDAADQKTNQGRGKDVERKSPQTDFPAQLANPAHYAGFALSHRLCYYWLTYETGHFICSQKRTFSLANDTSHLPTIQPGWFRAYQRRHLDAFRYGEIPFSNG